MAGPRRRRRGGGGAWRSAGAGALPGPAPSRRGGTGCHGPVGPAGYVPEVVDIAFAGAEARLADHLFLLPARGQRGAVHPALLLHAPGAGPEAAAPDEEGEEEEEDEDKEGGRAGKGLARRPAPGARNKSFIVPGHGRGRDPLAMAAAARCSAPGARAARAAGGALAPAPASATRAPESVSAALRAGARRGLEGPERPTFRRP